MPEWSQPIGRWPGIDAAAIFGSWAARAAGEAGPSPVGIDLLVIGRPDRDDLQDAAGRAWARLGREVNTVVVSADRWNSRGDAFLADLRGRPMAALPGIPESIDEDTVRDDLPHAEAVIEAVTQALPHLPVFSAEP